MLQQSYPVTLDIARPASYDRWKVGFRIILAIPQLIIVGGLSFSFVPGLLRSAALAGSGLSSIIETLAIFAWFTILVTGSFPERMREFSLVLFRWVVNVDAYVGLLTEPYPPFGTAAYPIDLQVTPATQYNRWTVAFRIILAIPHLIALVFLGIAALVVTIIAWFAILFTGEYPKNLYDFSLGVLRWGVRVGAYLYLFVDEYPPFSLGAQPGSSTAEPFPG